MLTTPVPENETLRLEALEKLKLMDTPAESRFDRYTRLASRLLDAPYALISLIDQNRQWVKSSHGILVKELPRKQSICAHTIVHNDLFVIDDLSKAPLFRESPLSSGADKVSFYAGVPLSLRDGLNLGTICIMDTIPRQLNQEDKRSLYDLASWVCDEMMMFVDDLTQLTNRRGFGFVGQPVISACHRHRGVSTIVIIELEGLEVITADHGLQQCNQVRKMFSQLMQQEFRDSDVIASLGSDKFGILLANSTEQEALISLDRLRTKLEQFNVRNHKKYRLEFSMGLAETARKKEPVIEEMLAVAEARLYEDIAFKRLSRTTRANPMVEELISEYDSFF